MKIVLLLVVALIPIFPALLLNKLKTNGATLKDFQLEDRRGRKQATRRNRRSLPRWKGPKTDERINTMLAESIELLKELGVPISDSICPEVRLTSAHSYYGCCCVKGSRKYCTDYDFYIEMSGWVLCNTEKSIRNTLLHELIHTVPGGLRHTGNWKKWADYVSKKTEYTIQRCDGDQTEEDKESLGRFRKVTV